jgi:hypothetical protein
MMMYAGFEEGIAEGKFGAVGKGIEEATAGGMHTLVVDAEGKVRLQPVLSPTYPVSHRTILISLCSLSGLVLGSERQRLAWSSDKQRRRP